MTDIKKYKQKNGKITYYFTVYLGKDPLTGKRDVVTRRGFDTEKQAKSALAKVMYEYDNGIYKSPNATTYKDLYDQWFIPYSIGLKDSTINSTKQIFRDHILPRIGDIQLDKLNSYHCQDLYNCLIKELKRGTAVYSYARKCYQYAITPLNLVNKNPFDSIYKIKVKKEKPTYNFLEIDELRALLNCIKDQEDYKWYVFFSLLGYTGLRKSEALALTWYDFDNGNLRINKSMTRNLDNKYVVGTPKTESGNRTIQLDENLNSLLLDWKKYQAKNEILSIDNLIFTNKNGGHIAQPKPLQVLDRVNERNNLKRITVHDLRRTHICHLFDAGLGIKEVQARVGQSDLKTTMEVYNFVTEYRKEKTITKFESYLIKQG